MTDNGTKAQATVRERIVRAALSVPRFVIGCLILISVAINFANVIGRYLFQSSIVWAEEAMIYIMIWCVFIGAVLVTWEGRHLKMDLLSTTLPERWKRVINVFTTSLFVFIVALVAFQSFKVTETMNALGQRSVVSNMPMAIPHAALLLGFTLMLVVVIVRLRTYMVGNFEGEDDDDARKPPGTAASTKEGVEA